MSVVCGTTEGAADSKISNQPVTFESNIIGMVRFEFESNLEASQVPGLINNNAVCYDELFGAFWLILLLINVVIFILCAFLFFLRLTHLTVETRKHS